MAAPNFVAQASTVEGGSSTIQIQVAIPDAGAGVTAGMRAVLVLGLSPSTVVADPTGWTRLQDNEANPVGSGRLYVWTAEIGSVAAVDPGATVSVDFTGGSRSVLAVAVYEASDAEASALFFDDSGADAATVSTPTVSTTDAARVVHIHGLRAGSGGQPTWTPDGATTERTDVTSNNGSSTNVSFLIADEATAEPGATTARTATPTLEVRPAAVTVALNVAVTRPVANAGPDQNVLAGATVNLNGTPSDGGGAGAPYTFQWTQVSGTSVVLNDATAEDPTFTAPASTDTIVFELVVTDTASVASLADSVTINVLGPENISVPIADDVVTNWTVEPDTDDVFEVTSDSSDATYAASADTPTDQQLRVKLAPFNQPETDDLVVLSARAAHVNASSGSITVSLLQGTGPGTLIATTTEALSGTIDQYQLQLTSTEIGDISDPDDLYADVAVSAA